MAAEYRMALAHLLINDFINKIILFLQIAQYTGESSLLKGLKLQSQLFEIPTFYLKQFFKNLA